MSGSGVWDCGWVSRLKLGSGRWFWRETIEGIQGVTMNRIVLAGLAVFAVVGSGVATRTLNGQAQATQANAAEYQQNVLPVLSKSCMSCHNDRSKAGTLSLDPFKDPFTALAQPAIWQKIVEKVSAGAMPPPTAASLMPAERDALLNFARKVPGVADAIDVRPSAGRVTA